MFQALLVLFISTAAFAAPSFHGYVHQVSKETGRSEREIRDEAVDALREDRRVSDEDLHRISRDQNLGADREIEIIDVLNQSGRFKERSGIADAEIAAVVAHASKAFEAMRETPKPVELTQSVQDQWVTLLLADQRPKPYMAVEGDFELRSVAKDFPPYGWTFMGYVTVDGKRVDLTDKDLMKATFDAAWGNRPARVRVLRGHLKAERIAREIPPYGAELKLELVLAKDGAATQ